jgi:hypothetical protein
MEKTNIEKELFAFSWPLFLFVSGVSSFLFSFALRVINGTHSAGFLCAGAIFLLLGILILLLNRADYKATTRNKLHK